MTVSIYGEEASFYRMIMEESPTWRRREFNEWLDKARRSHDAGEYFIAVDNLLDGLCYDNSIEVADLLLSYLVAAGALDSLSQDAQALVKQMRETNSAYNLKHVKLVAKLQHKLRAFGEHAPETAGMLADKSAAETALVLEDMLSPGLSQTLFGRSFSDAEMSATMELFNRMLEAPDSALDLMLEAMQSAGASEEAREQARSIAAMISHDLGEIEGVAVNNETDDTDDEEESLIVYSQTIGEIRRILNSNPDSYSQELAFAWRKILDDLRLERQFDFWALDDLWHSGNLALAASETTTNPQILEDAVYFLRRLVAKAAQLDDEDPRYTESLLAALDLYYDETQDEAILREIVAIGETENRS